MPICTNEKQLARQPCANVPHQEGGKILGRAGVCVEEESPLISSMVLVLASLFFTLILTRSIPLKIASLALLWPLRKHLKGCLSNSPLQLQFVNMNFLHVALLVLRIAELGLTVAGSYMSSQCPPTCRTKRRLIDLGLASCTPDMSPLSP
jgi:hypothetical protein